MKWKMVEITEEAHNMLKKWKETTGIEIRHLVSTAVKDAIYCREKHLGIKIINKEETDGQGRESSTKES